MKSLSYIAKELNKNRSRAIDIVSILKKYHLASWLSNIKVADFAFFTNHDTKEDFSHLHVGERMCLAFSEIGTTFIKLGQILSSRPDLIGEVACGYLSTLQNNAPTDSDTYVQQYLGNKLDRKILSFNSTPLASGSIAQAHLAQYKDGSPLIIKLMHEGISAKVKADLDILKALSHLAEMFDTPLKSYNPIQLVDNFATSLMAELDFGLECDNINTFTENFMENDEVCFPKLYDDLSSNRIICMERFEGNTLSNTDYNIFSTKEKERLAFLIADTFFEMVFTHQFYHADPHPGNLIYTPEKKIGIIDCGMVGRLSTFESESIEDLLIAVSDQNAGKICQTIVQMGFVPDEVDNDLLARDISRLIDTYFKKNIDKIDMKSIINDFNQLLYDYKIVLSSSVSMLLRLLVILEGTTKKLNTNFSIFELIQKYYFKIRIKRLDPKYIFSKAKNKVHEWTYITEELPRTLIKFVKKLEKDDFGVNMRHHNLSESVDKLVLAMISASIIVASALLMSARIEPLVGDLSIFGLVGVLLSIPLIVKTIKRLK